MDAHLNLWMKSVWLTISHVSGFTCFSAGDLTFQIVLPSDKQQSKHEANVYAVGGLQPLSLTFAGMMRSLMTCDPEKPRSLSTSRSMSGATSLSENTASRVLNSACPASEHLRSRGITCDNRS